MKPIIILFLLFCSGSVSAQVYNGVYLNGYGGWGYGRTDGNVYQYGNKNGNANNVFFTLALSTSPYENLNIISQVNWEEYGDGLSTELEYAFAEWELNDAFNFRFGRVKQPFGIYAEVFNVGTIRPFLLLPQGIYGPQGFTAKAYNGIGMTGLFYLIQDWGIQYDIYTGNIENNFTVPGFFTDDPENLLKGKVDIQYKAHDVIGGRVIVTTPLNSLSLGFSVYSTKPEIEGVSSLGQVESRNPVFGVQAEYLTYNWWLRAEYAYSRLSHILLSEGAYIELAYRLNKYWQFSGRYDWWDGELDILDQLPAVVSQMLSHRDTSFGVNYWFNTSFVVKTAIHFVEGNRFAFPDDPAQIAGILAGDSPDTGTKIIQLGVQYSF